MEHQEIVKFLENSKNYPHLVKKVRHLETYISDVFLTGKFAYKIKKPVSYGYLDFTTLAKRKFFCRRELELNRRLSPQMYISVLPLVIEKTKAVRRNRRLGSEGKLKFGDKDKIVEYVLKMKEIPQKYLMYRQLKKGRVNKKIISRLAKIVANFHQKAKTSKKISFFGSVRIIKKNWQENFSQTKPFIAKTISTENWHFIKKSIGKFIAENKNLFLQRIKNKKIRDCHGDLHTGNIFITPKNIFIFDCIEFNERFRYQDVASEVAFLAMDLDFLGWKNFSDYFVKKYIDYSGDRGLTKLLLFYKCYRAYVKGKVFGFHFAERELNKAKRKMYKKIARKSFIWAKKYAREMQKPILIIAAGLPGVGRSTRLKFLAPKIKAKILDSDVIRKKMFKKVKYNQKSKLLVYKKMIAQAENLLRTGKNVILDATFSKEKYRQLAKNLIKKLEIPYYFVEFYCSEKVAKQRLSERAKEKAPVSQANWEIYQKIKKEFEPIKKEPNYFRINTTDSPAKDVVQVLKIL